MSETNDVDLIVSCHKCRGKGTNTTERGWGGHFYGCEDCRFRRNTLIESDGQKIVVSTVGAYTLEDEMKTIGVGGRYYETMAFKAKKEGSYWEANVGEELCFDSERVICSNSAEELPHDVDNKANEMHDNVVNEFVKRNHDSNV